MERLARIHHTSCNRTTSDATAYQTNLQQHILHALHSQINFPSNIANLGYLATFFASKYFPLMSKHSNILQYQSNVSTALINHPYFDALYPSKNGDCEDGGSSIAVLTLLWPSKFTSSQKSKYRYYHRYCHKPNSLLYIGVVFTNLVHINQLNDKSPLFVG